MLYGPACAGGAMALFEELELWDNLIACYRLLQKKPQARCGIDAQASKCSHNVAFFSLGAVPAREGVEEGTRMGDSA